MYYFSVSFSAGPTNGDVLMTKKVVETNGKKVVCRYEYTVERVKNCHKDPAALIALLNECSRKGWDHYFSLTISSEDKELYFRRWNK